jgi:hypothetical protein
MFYLFLCISIFIYFILSIYFYLGLSMSIFIYFILYMFIYRLSIFHLSIFIYFYFDLLQFIYFILFLLIYFYLSIYYVYYLFLFISFYFRMILYNIHVQLYVQISECMNYFWKKHIYWMYMQSHQKVWLLHYPIPFTIPYKYPDARSQLKVPAWFFCICGTMDNKLNKRPKNNASVNVFTIWLFNISMENHNF